MKKIKVLLVDDHQLIRHGLKSLFNETQDIEVIGDVDSGEAAIEFLQLHHPDVVLMDLRMPGIGGLKATQQIAKNHPESHVLVVSSCDAEPFPSALLEAGAMGFLTKGSSNDEMLDAVRSVAAGIQYLSPEMAKAININRLDHIDGSPFNVLSAEELRVALMLIAGEKGQVIAEKMYIDPKMVSTYRSRIHTKLHVQTDVGLTLLAMRYGLVDNISIPGKE